jgi:hypothetical protein
MLTELSTLGFWIYPLLLWSIIWKGISLWKCGRQNQLYWFIALLIFNTAGILPIIYLLFFQKKSKVKKVKTKTKTKKRKKR